MPKTSTTQKRAKAKSAPFRVSIPAIVVPGAKANSCEVTPGKPVIEHGDDEISLAEAAKIIGLSQRRVLELIRNGRFHKDEFRQPAGTRGKVLIRRAAAWRVRNSTE